MDIADKHNLGRSVTDSGCGFIKKPRPVYWEWLFLSSESPIRNIFKGIDEDPFIGFPNLAFQISREHFSVHRVEKLLLANVDKGNSLVASEVIGRTLAVCKFFGLTDLHKENMFFGKNKEDQVIFCPVDIECIFEKSDCLSQNQLVRSTYALDKFQGLKSILDFKVNVAILLESYLKTLKLLLRNQKTISTTLLSLSEINTTPIRVVINSTGHYLKSIRENDFYGFKSEEVIQLKRKDVPYFYTYLGSGDLYYLNNEGVETKCSFKRSDTAALPIFYTEQTQFNFSQDTQFLKTSLCQLARALDPSSDEVQAGKSSLVKYTDNKIYINLLNKTRISCTRLSSKSLQQGLSA